MWREEQGAYKFIIFFHFMLQQYQQIFQMKKQKNRQENDQ